ncbi:MAG: alpha-ketoglutarate-dependent dioxygenase AlkB [Pseudomonadota bacterium]|nr:alpha-ketoglutarate-dependent dioxygenase AlkB [Pseudomonadota bacterium]
MSQASLFPSVPTLPEGLRYQPDLLSPDEERVLTARLRELPFRAFEFRGFEGRRRVVSFGWRYDFNSSRLEPAEPMPAFLLPLREKAAGLAGRPASDLAHALVTEYAPGAPIGWHRDRPEFDEVVGVSLLSPCLFRLRRKRGSGWERASFTAEPRSAYLLSGPARSEWEHSVPPVEALRYSVTFRTVRA